MTKVTQRERERKKKGDGVKREGGGGLEGQCEAKRIY